MFVFILEGFVVSLALSCQHLKETHVVSVSSPLNEHLECSYRNCRLAKGSAHQEAVAPGLEEVAFLKSGNINKSLFHLWCFFWCI